MKGKNFEYLQSVCAKLLQFSCTAIKTKTKSLIYEVLKGMLVDYPLDLSTDLFHTNVSQLIVLCLTKGDFVC
jgi:hypothetical protein